MQKPGVTDGTQLAKPSAEANTVANILESKSLVCEQCREEQMFATETNIWNKEILKLNIFFHKNKYFTPWILDEINMPFQIKVQQNTNRGLHKRQNMEFYFTVCTYINFAMNLHMVDIDSIA